MHDLPLWFLVLSLFLPRLSLFCLWINDAVFPIPQPLAAIIWVFLPRVMILLMIYGAQGWSLWLWVHIVFAGMAFLATNTQAVSRNQ